jgi:hypothetical protein
LITNHNLTEAADILTDSKNISTRPNIIVAPTTEAENMLATPTIAAKRRGKFGDYN